MNISCCRRKSKVFSSAGLIGEESSGRGERLLITGSSSAPGSRTSVGANAMCIVFSTEGDALVGVAERPDGLFGRCGGARLEFEVAELRDKVRETIGLSVVSRAVDSGGRSESSRDGAFVDATERARLLDRGAGDGGDGLAGRLEAILAFRLNDRLEPAPTGMEDRTEPLDGGGFGGGVRVPCGSNSYGGRGVPLRETLADASAVREPGEAGANGFALDGVLPFLGGGNSGAFNASLSLFWLICSTVTQPSSPSSLQGLPLRSELRTTPSFGG